MSKVTEQQTIRIQKLGCKKITEYKNKHLNYWDGNTKRRVKHIKLCNTH